MTATPTLERTVPGSPPSATWTTSCVYAHLSVPGTDALVREAIVPLAEQLVRTGRAQAWFFLRYWHGGPHVRVRFRDPEPAALADFEAQVADWLAEHPEHRLPIEEEAFREQFGQADPVPWRAHGEIVREPYLPETDRYGGPRALRRCEEFFELSSRIAAAALQPQDRRKVFAVGLDLMTLAMSVSSPTVLDAARAARRYFTAWDFTQESNTDRGTALAQSEQLQETWARAWDRRQGAIAEAVQHNPSSTHSLWQAGIEELLTDLAEIEAQEGLTQPTAAILWSLIHMMNNRLGISVHEERVLSWLASSISTGWASFADYFADSPQAPDRAYLQASKYAVGPQAAQQFPRQPGAGTTRPVATGLTAVQLPEAQPLGQPLGEVLQHRFSAYGDYGGSLPVQTLATVLGHGVGVVESRVRMHGATRVAPRSYPSPGGQYATSVLVNAWAVEGLDPGLYFYDADGHALLRWGPSLPRQVLQSASPTFGTEGDVLPGRPPVVLSGTVPVVLLLASDIAALRPKYGLRALRLLLAECGHLAQNLLLSATAAGACSIPVSAFSDDELSTAVHLDGIDGFISAILPLGSSPR